MNEYETVCIYKPDLPASRIEIISDKVQKILNENQAELITKKDWGPKKLAYPIGKFTFGHYFYFGYKGSGKFIPDLEKMLKYEEGVVRYLTIKTATEEEIKKGKRAAVTEIQEKMETQEQQSREDFELPAEL